MQLVINKSKLCFASRARFMLKHRERECIFLVYRKVWSRCHRSLCWALSWAFGGFTRRGHGSWLMRWAIPIIIPLLFSLKKSTFSNIESYTLLSKEAWRKEVQVIFMANSHLNLIQYISCEKKPYFLIWIVKRFPPK